MSNVISSGGIEGTEGLQRLSSEASWESRQVARNIPLGRYGLVKEVSDAIVFLFSEAGITSMAMSWWWMVVLGSRPAVNPSRRYEVLCFNSLFVSCPACRYLLGLAFNLIVI